jgi:transposase
MSKKYTKEFKQEAVKLVTDHGYSQAEAGRRLGVSEKNINRWVLGAKEKTPLKIEKPMSEQDEIKQLRKENDRLRMEKEILKKAAAFFANEKN